MKALVLGGSGFIGSHLVDRLLSKGLMVRVFDRFPEKYRSPLPGVEYKKGKFSDTFAIAEALDGVDIVYHLIGNTLPSTSMLDLSADIEDNLIDSVRFIEQMIKAKVMKIVFLSSGGTVYGNAETDLITEEHPIRPLCSYGIVKTAIENYLFMFQKLYGIFPIILRASNVYGPRSSHIGIQGIISTFLNKITNGEPLTVWGDGEVIRDYLYVDDLVNLCVKAGENEYPGIFNASSGVGYSVKQIIDIITSVTNERMKIVYKDKRAYDIKKIILDYKKAKDTFGWQPKTCIKEGINRYWEWMKFIQRNTGKKTT